LDEISIRVGVKFGMIKFNEVFKSRFFLSKLMRELNFIFLKFVYS